jgi:hypothetical protein
MRRVAVGLAAALTLGFAGSAFGESDFDEIQDEEQPGSEIGIQIGGGTVSAERENGAPIFPIAPYAAPAPVFPSAPYVAPTPVFPSAPYTAPAPIFPIAPLATRGGQLRPLDDPDAPVAGDPIDRELPGEGPEDLSGPDDDDSLPD